MPTTEQILNKSATIYGQVGKSLQILNKRDKLKGADNAYVSVSNLDSINTFLNKTELYPKFEFRATELLLNRYTFYEARIKNLIVDLVGQPSRPQVILAADVFANLGAVSAHVLEKIVIKSSENKDAVFLGPFNEVVYSDSRQGEVIVDFQVGGTYTMFSQTSVQVPNNSIVNMRVKPTALSPAFYLSTGTHIGVINVSWSEGEVAGAPWGATNATINYDVTDFPE